MKNSFFCSLTGRDEPKVTIMNGQLIGATLWQEIMRINKNQRGTLQRLLNEGQIDTAYFFKNGKLSDADLEKVYKKSGKRYVPRQMVIDENKKELESIVEKGSKTQGKSATNKVEQQAEVDDGEE